MLLHFIKNDIFSLLLPEFKGQNIIFALPVDLVGFADIAFIGYIDLGVLLGFNGWIRLQLTLELRVSANGQNTFLGNRLVRILLADQANGDGFTTGAAL